MERFNYSLKKIIQFLGYYSSKRHLGGLGSPIRTRQPDLAAQIAIPIKNSPKEFKESLCFLKDFIIIHLPL